MAKKSEQITTHVTPELKAKAQAMAHAQGYSNVSEWVNHLIHASADEQQKAMDMLAPAFGYSQNSESSEGSQRDFTQFMRVATQEAEPLHH